MADEILRREGENILNEAGEVVARFEANNIIKVGGSGGVEIKSFEYEGTGDNAKTDITFPETPAYILGIYSHAVSGARITYYPIPYIEGENIAEIMSYSMGGSGVQYGNIYCENNNIEITGFADITARLNVSGQKSTIYYI